MELNKASHEIITARRHLAKYVGAELRRAGLPVIGPGTDDLTTPGAMIEVGFGNDAAGGVFLGWATSSELRQQAVDAVAANDLNHPAILHKGAICQAMVTAMSTILADVGFVVKPTDDRDYRPLQAQICSCPHTAAAVPSTQEQQR